MKIQQIKIQSLLSILMFVLVLTGMSACDNNEDDSNKPNEFNYEQINKDFPYWKNLNIVIDSAYLINSNEELLSFFNLTDTNFGIDFENHSLILVLVACNTGIYNITTDMQPISNGIYNMLVRVYQDYTAMPETRMISILTSKIPNESIINCNVSYIQD